jgi:GT2 family glycosyltransferase
MSYYNRKVQFLRTLSTIRLSQHKDVEIIVVDDGSEESQRLEDVDGIKLIRVEPKDKWYINPCIPFNMGIKEATGDIIMLMNPECLHVDDVISHAVKNVSEDNYISYACYSLDKHMTSRLKPRFTMKDLDGMAKLVTQLYQKRTNHIGGFGWYNHSKIAPMGYHFTSAITKSNMDKLGGFDEQYFDGVGFDDDELLFRIKSMGLKVEIPTEELVIHQWHYSGKTLNDIAEENLELVYRNRDKFEYLKSCSKQKKTGVPKIAHFYWGSTPMPYLVLMGIVSFKVLNKGWRVVLHTSETTQKIASWQSHEHKTLYTGPDFKHLLYKVPEIEVREAEMPDILKDCHDVLKSDYLRLKLMAGEGGVWSDADILYHSTLGTWTDLVRTGICFDGTTHIVGFLMSSGNNKVFAKLLEEFERTLNVGQYQSLGSNLYNRVIPYETIKDEMESGEITNLPLTLVYPNHAPQIGIAHGEEIMYGAAMIIDPKVLSLLIPSGVIDRSCTLSDGTKLKNDMYSCVGKHWYQGAEFSKVVSNNLPYYRDTYGDPPLNSGTTLLKLVTLMEGYAPFTRDAYKKEYGKRTV